ncbi:FAD-dependent oxidoreductase [Mycolicibacterium neoaurum]|uniref:FAD-dependent oxidoreductase n=1 Tax=Mycolicibacterium neoaurum TaxID=1795 RepID=UPI001BD07DE6|nr:FAD-dependent oxidoreductase [Mycolicibacterium neoaurum]QVI25573.1 FAD-dependent oxidoreductase [Mycolicibacterium neoaurum]
MPTPQPSTDTDVIVIGAGPAGAAAARVLTAAGVHTVLLDREHAVGGRTRTDRKHGFAIDSGAIFVMGTYRRTRSAIAGAGREHHMRRWVARTELREARGRYPVRFDAPHTFLRVPQLRWTDRVRLVAGIAMLMLRRGPEPFDLRSLADDDNGETMEAWSRRMFGDRVHEYVVRPLMEPLTGADLSTISRSFLVALLRNAHRTRLTVPEDGLDRVTSWQLDDVDVRLNVHVESVRRESAGLAVHAADGVLTARAVIVATDAHTAAELCTDPWPDAGPDLVVPVGPGPHSDIGVLLGQRRRPGSAPEGGQVVSVYFDGPRSAALGDRELLTEARRIVTEVHGPAEPDITEIYRRAYGLSTAAPGHYQRMLAVLARLPHDVQIAGDYLTQSGIEGAYIAGERAAREILGSLGAG